ncbi:MAG TPA: hypothetical protein VFF50_06105 [Candidatus Deferrimicrobiaceae bacterium]|jgi:hypothetical protein|nr:hypothetical protein [Candidatus Deferrimicrobiaceae bacterium]
MKVKPSDNTLTAKLVDLSPSPAIRLKSGLLGCRCHDDGLWGVPPVQLLLEFNRLILRDRPSPASSSLPMLASVAGVSQELRALAAPVELAPAPMATAFSVPNEDRDDRFGLDAYFRLTSTHL